MDIKTSKRETSKERRKRLREAIDSLQVSKSEKSARLHTSFRMGEKKMSGEPYEDTAGRIDRGAGQLDQAGGVVKVKPRPKTKKTTKKMKQGNGVNKGK